MFVYFISLFDRGPDSPALVVLALSEAACVIDLQGDKSAADTSPTLSIECSQIALSKHPLILPGNVANSLGTVSITLKFQNILELLHWSLCVCSLVRFIDFSSISQSLSAASGVSASKLHAREENSNSNLLALVTSIYNSVAEETMAIGGIRRVSAPGAVIKSARLGL